MAISTRPISGAGISGDDEEISSLTGRGPRRIRARVLRDRYPGIDADAPVEPVEEVKPTPIYDALSAAEKDAVDRLIVGFRMAQKMEIA